MPGFFLVMQRFIHLHDENGLYIMSKYAVCFMQIRQDWFGMQPGFGIYIKENNRRKIDKSKILVLLQNQKPLQFITFITKIIRLHK